MSNLSQLYLSTGTCAFTQVCKFHMVPVRESAFGPDGVQAHVALAVVNTNWNYADTLKFRKQPLILNLDIN